MSTVTTGSLCPCRYSWMFAWTVETTFEGYERRSSPFAYKRREVHLKFTKDSSYKVELCTLYSFPSLSVDDMIFRVETKSKTPLDLPDNRGVGPNDKILWLYSEDRILAEYPDFRKDGGILTFLLCNVDPPETNPVRFSNVSRLSGLERLSSDLSVLLGNQDSGADLVLLCGEDHSIKVHKNIVSARSKVISAMLKSDMSEGRTGRIEIKDMSSEVFDHFVHYLYIGRLLDLNVDTARGLYEASDQYEMGNLMRHCAIFLVENLTPENACELLILADAHGDQDFKEHVMDYIVINKIPLQEDHWLPFHGTYPELSFEVVYRLCKWQNK